MQKTRIKGKKSMQYLVKVNCETDFPVGDEGVREKKDEGTIFYGVRTSG